MLLCSYLDKRCGPHDVYRKYYRLIPGIRSKAFTRPEKDTIILTHTRTHTNVRTHCGISRSDAAWRVRMCCIHEWESTRRTRWCGVWKRTVCVWLQNHDGKQLVLCRVCVCVVCVRVRIYRLCECDWVPWAFSPLSIRWWCSLCVWRRWWRV